MALVPVALVAVFVAAGIGVSFSSDPGSSSPASMDCSPHYTGACVPNVTYDLNCADIGHQTVEIVDSDPYGFDGDGDGVGCE